jgi:exonuclease SbcC
MITRLFHRSALHEHADPEQRILGIAQLDPAAEELDVLLREDPSLAVRRAAAERYVDLQGLLRAYAAEADVEVKRAIAVSLGTVIGGSADDAQAQSVLESDAADDVVRSEVARRADDPARRRLAVAAIRDESNLLDIALHAGQAETRALAAERVTSTRLLEQLAEAARSKDHGVYRSVKQRLDAIRSRAEQDIEADHVLEQLEALATRPGPILTDVIELNRRWQALDMSADSARVARSESARRGVQARLEREQEEQRARTRDETKLREWCDALQSFDELPDAVTLERLRGELDELRREANERADARGSERLEEAAQRMAQWERETEAVVAAETLVLEAERLAMGTYIDHGDLPSRWEALDRAIRTPALTRRFEAALTTVEQRRAAHVQIAQQEASALRQHLHALLHTAEQALAAGQLKDARTGADELKKLRGGAGNLPKPTVQRISRLQQLLVEMERWEAFGQHTARTQLCERAEALAGYKGDLRQLAQEVQTLRNEWKVLDQQHAGVPKSLWERFDHACEKAYAPAGRHFAEQATRRKESRKKREDFIALAAEHATMLASQEPQDWRALERWLRDTDQQWREGDLGSIEPKSWKELDARMKEAVAPLRTALGAARDAAKQERRNLIDQVKALVEKAFDRDTPSQVKTIQAQWQQHAKGMSLAQRDERALWDEFRGACDAVFQARQEKRKEEDGAKHEVRHALEQLCAELDALAAAHDKGDQEVRRQVRALQDQWAEKAGRDPAFRGLENRFRAAKANVEAALASRVRSRESAVWQTLAAKERLCCGYRRGHPRRQSGVAWRCRSRRGALERVAGAGQCGREAYVGASRCGP